MLDTSQKEKTEKELLRVTKTLLANELLNRERLEKQQARTQKQIKKADEKIAGYNAYLKG